MKTGDIFSIKETLYVRRCGVGRIELRKRGRYGEDSLLQWMVVYGCKGTEMFLRNGVRDREDRVLCYKKFHFNKIIPKFG